MSEWSAMECDECDKAQSEGYIACNAHATPERVEAWHRASQSAMAAALCETVSPKANAVPAHVVATTDDIVRHPAHYTQGIECWDYITSHGLGFLEGNVIKYVTRYKHKNGLEDLLKARQYLERLIKEQGGTPLTEF